MRISLFSFNLKVVMVILVDISFYFLFACFNHERTFFFPPFSTFHGVLGAQ